MARRNYRFNTMSRSLSEIGETALDAVQAHALAQPAVIGGVAVPVRKRADGFNYPLPPLPRYVWYRTRTKRMIDIGLVLLSLPLTLPLIGLMALAMWREGGRPFFGQARLGKGGKIFTMWKMRTMVPDAEARLQACLDADPSLQHEWQTTQKLKSDPRITTLGRFLRKTSLDELPQIFNVLRGEMSLVGPRPMLPDQVHLYGGDTTAYFAMQPGLTGLWQISERNEGYFARRALSDARYERIASLRVDLEVIVRTVGVVFRGTGY